MNGMGVINVKQNEIGKVRDKLEVIGRENTERLYVGREGRSSWKTLSRKRN